ncbi:MAG TPA: hypothetical protein PLL15_03300 [Syntrophales bacterium]|nr:hypothetical protein [Syntrophales bacterium]
MASQDISLIIKANDQATEQIKKLRQEIGSIRQSAETAAKGLSWMGDFATKTYIQFAALSQSVQGLAAAWGKMKQYIDLGSEALRAEEAFRAMSDATGVAAAALTEKMKKAAGGFVDDSHLMQKAAFALSQDIDPDKIPQLIEAARVAARNTGRDVAESIDGIIQAVSTNMPRSLRQMGLISKEQMGLLEQAATAGVTEVGLLDLVLAKAALTQAQYGAAADNAAKEIKRLEVQIGELKETIGKGLIEGLQRLLGALQGVAGFALGAAVNIFQLMQASNALFAMGAEKMGQAGKASEYKAQAREWALAARAAEDASNELYRRAMENMYGGGPAGDQRSPAQKSRDIATAQARLNALMEDLKRRIAAAKGGGSVDRIREEWAKIERDLSADIAKSGLGEYEKRLIDIDKRVEELKKKAAELPTEMERAAAGGIITSWADAMKDQLAADDLQKEVDALLAANAEGHKALKDLDRSLTEARASELQKRLNAVDETAKKERELADQALLRRVISEEEYAAKGREIAAVAADAKKKIQADYERSVREAEINARLADLDLLEKEGLAHRETLAERIELTKELIRVEEEHLATMDKRQDEAGWYAQSDKVTAARKTYADLTREMAMTRPFGALKLSMDDVVNRWTDAGQQMYDVATSTAQAMQQAFSDFFFDTFQGKLKSLGDYVNSFLTSVQRAVANALSQQMSAGIGGLINAGVGALFGGGKVEGYHNGGVVGETAPTFYRVVPSAAFAGARRMHDGWLGADEVPAILQKGEWVLSRRDVAAMKAAATGDGAPNVAVNIINQTGTPLSGSQQGSPRFDGKKWVLDIVVEGLDRYAPLRTALGNMRS